MKAYVTTTGAVFALLTFVHVWRVIQEPHLATDPWYVLISAVAAALCLWASRLLWLASKEQSKGRSMSAPESRSQGGPQ